MGHQPARRRIRHRRARNVDQLTTSLAAADLHLGPDAMDMLTAVTAPTAAAYPYGPIGAAQRDPTANGPEALSQLVKSFAENTST